ncbi:MAG TPA: DUF4855 domain-containing protein [Gemmatimonadales bacterium]|jgi:hypothetical protein|nr:DUF4855 domain-containing protein [Gemmatimonadales bacterium]
MMRHLAVPAIVGALTLSAPVFAISSDSAVPPTHWILAYPGTAKGGMGTPYSVDDFVRLLGGVDSTGRVTSWLSTGVIFLQLYAASGHTFTTWIGGTPATGADWREYLDSIIGPGGAMARLDSAASVVESTAGALGAAIPVAIMIPYPEPRSDSLVFAGATYSYRSATGRIAAAGAYVDAGAQQFAQARFRHLRLDGFYWLSESVSPADQEVVVGVAEWVHRDRLRFLWIPFYTAPGEARWRELGFDEAWLQPNYFFNLSVMPGRVDSAASRARSEGLGIEVEFNSRLFTDTRYCGRLDPYLRMLEDTIFAGRSIALYDGQGALIRLSRSADPRDRMTYARLVRALTRHDGR